MVMGRGKSGLVVFLLLLSLIVAGCVRTLPGGSDEADIQDAVTTDTGEPGAAGSEAVTGDTGSVDAAGAADANVAADAATGDGTADTPRDDTVNDTAAADAATDQSEEAAGGAETDAAKSESADTPAETSDAAAADTTTADTTEESAAAADTAGKTDAPGAHTVAAGENLYRIGLQYGVSWVTLAEVNNLQNPNQIIEGQTLQIPGGDAATAASPEATPSPLTETTYTVKAGDNLFRVGLAYGISWVQIAEANGIVNPNQITVGDVLKIPVDTPGPAPQFTHEVKTGENLFLISVQYGVTWTKIAEANDIGSPYVIYPGQTLVIPGE